MSEDGDVKYRKLLASLQDPTVVKQLASQHGLLPTGDGKKEEKKPVIDLGEFDLGIEKMDDETLANLPSLLNKAFNSFAKALTGKLTEHFENTEKAAQQKTVEENKIAASKKLRAFMEATPDFLKHQEKISKHMQLGHPVEEAYRLAKLEAGEKVDDKGGKKDESKSDSNATPITPRHGDDIEGDDKEVRRKPAPTIKDAISRNLEQVLKDVPDLLD